MKGSKVNDKIETATFKELERSPSDEFLLTELGWDNRNFKIYDVSSLIMVRETPDP